MLVGVLTARCVNGPQIASSTAMMVNVVTCASSYTAEVRFCNIFIS